MNISDLQEDSVDLRILAVESSSSFDTARALVGLKDEQEFGDKFIAFFHQVLFVEVNSHVALENLKANKVSLLVLVQVLSQHIGTLSMGLSPFVVFNVEELQAQDTFS